VAKREFFKQSRRENFDDQGSLRLTEIEQNAYRNIVTFEAVELMAPRYANFKTLPENTHYGYVTHFEGDSVTKVEGVKFPLYRLSDTRNEMLWHFYQLQEMLNLIQGFNESIANAVVEELKDSAPNLIQFVLELTEPGSGPADRVWEWLISLVDDPSNPPPSEPFIPLPIDSPHPTVIKFSSDVPMRFSLRLDSWFLANPVVYVVGSVVDSEEPTEGEGEYPDNGDTNNPAGGTHGDNAQSLPPADSDPLDFSPDITASDATIRFTVYPIVNGQNCQPYDKAISNFAITPGVPVKLPLTLKVGGAPPGPVCGSMNWFQGFSVIDADGNEYAVNGSSTQVLYPGAAISQVTVSNP
jgi:hypothetical protein